jgi:hypothetical protein
MAEEPPIVLRENSQLTIDVKSLVGILAMMLSVAGVYFTLTGQINQLQLDVIRLQDSVALNEEFRIKWPRGELGALPDDAVQDINIRYIQGTLGKLQDEHDKHVDEHQTPTK